MLQAVTIVALPQCPAAYLVPTEQRLNAMASIVLSTLNARYIHASLGLRYLLANLGLHQPETRLLEFQIQQQPAQIAERILAESPAIVGFGVYIWNITETTQVVAILKRVRPDLVVVLGGPEVSYECDEQRIVQLADYVITGWGDVSFLELVDAVLAGARPPGKIITGKQPALDAIALPYAHYSDTDIAQRLIYVEASRGCPFKCEFCLSSLDKTAWPFELDGFLEAMGTLYDRGARHFKFVDRTFNLNVASSLRILEFFLERMDERLFVHFEVIPDHLPDPLKAAIVRFPTGRLQFEIGIQSWNPQVQSLISRKQNSERTEANLRWLREQTGAHIHADLIAGLPGESLDSFAAGFDRLVALQPHEIQVGILKRLRGTPIARHTEAFDLRFNPDPPYNILANAEIDFLTMQRVQRFARYWDLIGNSGRFQRTLATLLHDTPFARFMQLSDWLWERTGQTHAIELDRLFDLVFESARLCFGLDEPTLRASLAADYAASGARGAPRFLAQSPDRELTRKAARESKAEADSPTIPASNAGANVQSDARSKLKASNTTRQARHAR